MWEKMKGKILEISKRPIKSGWVITIAAASILLVLVMFFLGFRIMYSPNLENSWDAISAFAAWAGVGTSLGAIWAAVQIPKKIAERQDKIALFEKRFEFYKVIYNSILFAENKEGVCSTEVMQRWFISTFGDGVPSDTSPLGLKKEAANLSLKVVSVFHQGEFLFSFNAMEWVAPLMFDLQNVLSANNIEELQKYLKNYQRSANAAEKDLLPKIKNVLKIGDL